MHRLTQCIVILAMGAVAPAPRYTGQVAKSDDVSELTRLERVWNDAHIRGDAEALERLWSPDLIIQVASMPVISRQQALDITRSGRFKFDRYETSDLRIKVYGDAAVVTGRLRRTRNFNGRNAEDDWRFTKVYIRTAEGWRVVAWHGSPAAEPAPSPGK